MRASARLLRVSVTVDSPPPTTSLTHEEFDSGTTGDAIATDTTSMTTITGSGSCTFSDEWSLTGGLSMKVAGTAQHYGIFTLDQDAATITSHSDHFVSLYLRYSQQPGDTAWLYELRDGTDAATAARIGITATGTLIISDGP